MIKGQAFHDYSGSDINYLLQGMAWAQFSQGSIGGRVWMTGCNVVANGSQLVFNGVGALASKVGIGNGSYSWAGAQRDLAQATYTAHKFSQIGFAYETNH